MVNHKIYIFKFRLNTTFAVFIMLVLFAFPGFSQVTINGKVQLNTGWQRLKIPNSIGVAPSAIGTHDVWLSDGYIQLNLITEGSQIIKGYISGSYSINTPDIEELTTTGNKMAVKQEAKLDRAYLKVRLPWFDSQKMRLHIGKMPVSWGYGMVYNAGDIIFGVLPDSTSGFVSNENSLSEMRIATDWFVNAILPIVSGLTLEPLVRLPLTLDISEAKSKQQASFGGRFFWTPYWQILESAEIGYLASGDGKTHYAYTGFDGTLYVDYTFCAQMSINTDLQDLSDAEWVVSGTLSKIITFINYNTGYELPVTIRLESLWKPTQDNHSVMFAFVSGKLTDDLSLAFNWIGTIRDGDVPRSGAAHLLSASLTLIPIANLEFTLSGSIDAEKPSDTSSVRIGVTYRF